MKSTKVKSAGMLRSFGISINSLHRLSLAMYGTSALANNLVSGTLFASAAECGYAVPRTRFGLLGIRYRTGDWLDLTLSWDIHTIR